MGITIKAHFETSVTEANKDVYTGSFIEGKKTIIEFDMRKRDWQQALQTNSKISWYPQTSKIDIYEFSTFHCPIVYRFTMARGYYTQTDGSREYFTTKPSEVSTHHHMSKNIIRLACFLAVICGVTLRNIALIYSSLFQIPVSKSCIKRWIDEIGAGLSEDDILKKLIDQKTPHECNIDGYYPKGTDKCVMVIKDEYDRILITHEADRENAKEANAFLNKLKDLGLNITYVFSDYSKSYISAIKEVFPKAKFQADHFHTAKNIWKHLKKGLLEYRREVKSTGEKEKDKDLLELATQLWKIRWTLLKKPSNLSNEERYEIESIETKDKGFIKSFRSIIRQIANIFDYSNTEIQAKTKFKDLKILVEKSQNSHLGKICTFLEEHWDEAMQYLRARGLSKYKRASNSESGMRILRRLEKNHDGIRSDVTRKNYIKIYQTIKYLSEDVTVFLNPNPDN